MGVVASSRPTMCGMERIDPHPGDLDRLRPPCSDAAVEERGARTRPHSTPPAPRGKAALGTAAREAPIYRHMSHGSCLGRATPRLQPQLSATVCWLSRCRRVDRNLTGPAQRSHGARDARVTRHG